VRDMATRITSHASTACRNTSRQTLQRARDNTKAIGAGAVHGIVDYGVQTYHGLQENAAWMGSEFDDCCFQERASFMNSVAESNACQAAQIDSYIQRQLGIDPSSSIYQNSRYYTNVGLTAASVAYGAYGIGKGLWSLGRGILSGTSEVSAIARTGATAQRAITTKPDFIVGSNGVTISTNRKVLETGFQNAGFTSFQTNSQGVGYVLPNGNTVRIMEPAGKAPLRASFSNANGGPINPFTGTPPQPPKTISPSERKIFVRQYTHLELFDD